MENANQDAFLIDHINHSQNQPLTILKTHAGYHTDKLVGKNCQSTWTMFPIINNSMKWNTHHDKTFEMIVAFNINHLHSAISLSCH